MQVNESDSTPNTETETNEPAATPAAEANWESLGLSEPTLELIRKAGFTKPTPVQIQSLPPALDGYDIIASAQTGSGKTASFVLPMVEQFAGREGTFGLILAPTRELAQQIQATIEIFGTPRGIRSAVLIGGIDMRYDTKALDNYPQIIVATPGRLCDHLERGNLWLDYIEIVVLDEADRMLDMGFSTQLNRIMEEVPKDRQTLLFSATIPPTVQKLADKILYDPVRIAIGKPLSAAQTVEQQFLWMKEDSKNGSLIRLLEREKGSAIVFAKSKDKVTRVWRSLHSAGLYDATYIHSDRPQSHREQALAEFKEGKFRVLVATDVAGRGIHVENVQLVVNYDLPMEPEDYVHRIGRTGRAGSSGRSVTFVSPEDRRRLSQIERLLGRTIEPEGGDRGGDREDRSERSGGRDSSRDSGRDSGRGRSSAGRSSGEKSGSGRSARSGDPAARPTARGEARPVRANADAGAEAAPTGAEALPADSSEAAALSSLAARARRVVQPLQPGQARPAKATAASRESESEDSDDSLDSEDSPDSGDLADSASQTEGDAPKRKRRRRGGRGRGPRKDGPPSGS